MPVARVEFQSDHPPAKTWWFTGLPGAGKTTLAEAWALRLKEAGRFAVVLDGDDLRLGLSKDLGFSEADRHENMRRVAEVARLLNREHIDAVVALVSPTQTGRAAARAVIGTARFVEIHVATPLAICQQRHPWPSASSGTPRASTSGPPATNNSSSPGSRRPTNRRRTPTWSSIPA